MEGAERAVSKLDLPHKVTDFLTSSWGIVNLHPPQFEAMPSVLGGSNTLLAIPTASGKSLVAYIGIMKRILVDDPGSKAVYIVPLKALASEKFDDLSELCAAVGLSVGLGIGDASAEGIEDFLHRSDFSKDLICSNAHVPTQPFHLFQRLVSSPQLRIQINPLKHAI